MMKEVGGPPALDLCDVVREERAIAPKRKQGGQRAASCPPDCPHTAPLPSDVFIEMKVCSFVATTRPQLLAEAKVGTSPRCHLVVQEMLSVAVGPRTEEELPAACQVEALLQRLRDALVCRKVEKTGPHQLITFCCPRCSPLAPLFVSLLSSPLWCPSRCC